jgi:hypothetical protein
MIRAARAWSHQKQRTRRRLLESGCANLPSVSGADTESGNRPVISVGNHTNVRLCAKVIQEFVDGEGDERLFLRHLPQTDRIGIGGCNEALLNRFYEFLSDEHRTQITELFNPTTGQREELGGFREFYVGDKSFNVFNSAYVVGADNRVESPNFEEPNGWTEPRRMRLGVRYTF